jgi:hypothetical protein
MFQTAKLMMEIGAVDLCARISRAIVAAKEYLRYEPV